MIEYDDEDLLMLSGIQHIAFCERQWAFIHLEQQWAENRLTIEGQFLHEKVDDPLYMNLSRGAVILRSVSISSRILGLYGFSDAIELLPSKTQTNSITCKKYPGYWLPVPIEYKHGKPKMDSIDEVQLCAQAICLEEMYSISIEKGYLYYGEIRHRTEVQFTKELRELTFRLSDRMHELYKNNITPPPHYEKKCKACSLHDICMPETFSKKRSVNSYLKEILE
ncbi:CRISPR-associated exonuclease Cas4 [Bacteroides luti]|uniref:CRISPR-associated exonuclease Cas4 n=1 Tax=Bacteroides luti TaxID=1297750 RepID=A0A1M5DN82_9BACE|nr:CRISPR-associated protein Cas4 [Bacteroides luti]SHF68437.1 CRISPR-associated exonuclease Cas4 [Bacteroides luti]